MTKHTPGPWISEGDNVYREDDRIAKVCGNTDDQAYANARLIAAAPELAQAIRDILKWIDAGCHPSNGSIKRARAAIAKAEGSADA